MPRHAHTAVTIRSTVKPLRLGAVGSEAAGNGDRAVRSHAPSTSTAGAGERSSGRSAFIGWRRWWRWPSWRRWRFIIPAVRIPPGFRTSLVISPRCPFEPTSHWQHTAVAIKMTASGDCGDHAQGWLGDAGMRRRFFAGFSAASPRAHCSVARLDRRARAGGVANSRSGHCVHKGRRGGSGSGASAGAI